MCRHIPLTIPHIHNIFAYIYVFPNLLYRQPLSPRTFALKNCKILHLVNMVAHLLPYVNLIFLIRPESNLFSVLAVN